MSVIYLGADRETDRQTSLTTWGGGREEKSLNTMLLMWRVCDL